MSAAAIRALCLLRWAERLESGAEPLAPLLPSMAPKARAARGVDVARLRARAAALASEGQG